MPSPYTKKERRADLIDSPQICVFLTFVLDTPEQQNGCFAGRSSGGWQRTSAIGFCLPASCRAVPIAWSFHKGCGWTEVSLSSLPVIALSWAARYWLPIGIALVFKNTVVAYRRCGWHFRINNENVPDEMTIRLSGSNESLSDPHPYYTAVIFFPLLPSRRNLAPFMVW